MLLLWFRYSEFTWFFFTCFWMINYAKMKREALVGHLSVCDKEIHSVWLKQTKNPISKWNITSRIIFFLLGKTLPQTAYKPSMELLSCSTYMSNGNCLMTKNFSVQTELPNNSHSYAKHPRHPLLPTETNQAIIGIFDIEAESWRTSDFWQKEWFPCICAEWVSGVCAECKKTCKFIS